MFQPNIGHGSRGVKRGYFQPWVEPQGRGVKRTRVKEGHFQPWIETQDRGAKRTWVKGDHFQPWVETLDHGAKRTRVKGDHFQPWVEPKYRDEDRGVKEGYFQPWVGFQNQKEVCKFQESLLLEKLTPLHIDCSLEYEVVDEITIPKDSAPLLIIHPDYQLQRAEGVLSPREFWGKEQRTRSETFEKLTTPLHIDCSLEYEVVDEITIPIDSAPLLIIHPDYQMQGAEGGLSPREFGGTELYPHITTGTPRFSDLPTTLPQRTLLTDSANQPPPGFHIRNILRQLGKKSQKNRPKKPPMKSLEDLRR